MASKQLGKLRQWGREVISSKDKTVLTEEFKELEQDVELRRVGIERLHGACTEYHAYLHKKKEYTTVEEGVKMLPVDALGAVMMSHGEEFGDDSAFGQCLLKLGRAHCKIATLQETYALTFRDSYLASLEGALAELGDYTAQRKKLDSRRLAYDAAATKAQKAKKEKEVKEAEEELSKAKLRYEETSTDVQARMHVIRENETQQLRDLTQLLAAETRFVAQYLDILRDTQDEWLDESVIQSTEPRRRKAIPHAFASGRSTPSILSTSKTSVSARPSSVSTGGTAPSSEGDEENEFGYNAKRRGSPANTSRPSSRGSATSIGTAPAGKHRRGSSVGSDGVSASKKMSVAGWASSAVSSLSGSGRGKKEGKRDKSLTKERDKGTVRAFASLEDTADESDDDGARKQVRVSSEGLSRSLGSSTLSRVLGQPPPLSNRSHSNPLNSSSSSSSFNSISASGSSAPSAPRKLVRAVHEFSGSTDELSFRTGDLITVLSEGKGGWSTGELAGQRGLFPMSYTEEVPSSRARVPIPLTSMPPRMTSIAQRAQNDTTSEDGASVASEDLHDAGHPIRLYDEPFGDHNLAKSPMVAEHEHEHDPSIDTDEEDEMRGLFGPLGQQRPAGQSIEIGNAEGNGVVSHTTVARQPPALPQRRQSTKKPPPPPPARRSTLGASSAPTYIINPTAPSISAPASSANLPDGLVTFPPPPAAPRRSTPRSRSSIALGRAITPSVSVSPFDN